MNLTDQGVKWQTGGVPLRWPITANSLQTRCHVSNEYAFADRSPVRVGVGIADTKGERGSKLKYTRERALVHARTIEAAYLPPRNYPPASILW